MVLLQVNSVPVEDDIMKDSDTEGSEIPLGKLMKRLKAKAAKARKEVKNESAPAGKSNENDFDILKMVDEINSDNMGKSSKTGSSNNHEHKKKRGNDNLQKRKSMFNESKDVPVPKRKRTSSGLAHKSVQASPSKGSKTPSKLEQENNGDDSDKVDEDLQTTSEDKVMKEKKVESADSDLLISSAGKKSSAPPKQKGKRSDRDHEAHHQSPESKVCFLVMKWFNDHDR